MTVCDKQVGVMDPLLDRTVATAGMLAAKDVLRDLFCLLLCIASSTISVQTKQVKCVRSRFTTGSTNIPDASSGYKAAVCPAAIRPSFVVLPD